jgi:CBS domain-containing protein
MCYYEYSGNYALLLSLLAASKGVCLMIARDIMTHKVCVIQPEASAQEAAQLLDQMRISGLPVVSMDGRIIGIITEADIISKVDREGLRVADIMSHEVTVVDEETSVSEIALLLSERKIKRVPVVRDGRLVGIVSRADIVHAVAQGHLIIRPW